MKEYTEKIHAERLLAMLNNPKPCSYCPASRNFDASSHPDELWDDYSDSCKVCGDFIALTPNERIYYSDCPCKCLGGIEAIKRSWISLEEKGYI